MRLLCTSASVWWEDDEADEGGTKERSCSSTDETRRRIEMKLKLSRFLPNNELHSYLAKSHHLLRIRSSATTELRPTTEADLIIFNFANVTQSEKFLRDVSCLCHRSFRDHLAQVVGVRSSHVNNIRRTKILLLRARFERVAVSFCVVITYRQLTHHLRQSPAGQLSWYFLRRRRQNIKIDTVARWDQCRNGLAIKQIH